MIHVKRPTGLIRYASENNIAKGEKLKPTVRAYAYSAVLVILFGVLVTLLATRKDIQANVMRVQGMLYQEQPNNKISNLYNIKLINKTRKDLPVTIKLENDEIDGTVKIVGKDIVVKAESAGDGVFFVYANRDKVVKHKTMIYVGVYSGNRKIDVVKTNFMGPAGR